MCIGKKLHHPVLHRFSYSDSDEISPRPSFACVYRDTAKSFARPTTAIFVGRPLAIVGLCQPRNLSGEGYACRTAHGLAAALGLMRLVVNRADGRGSDPLDTTSLMSP